MTVLFDTEAVPTSPLPPPPILTSPSISLDLFHIRDQNARLEITRRAAEGSSCVRQTRSCSLGGVCVRLFSSSTHQLYRLTATPRYEWFLSLNFDFSFVLGKRKFRWPMVVPFYTIPLRLFSSLSRFSTSRTDISFFSR